MPRRKTTNADKLIMLMAGKKVNTHYYSPQKGAYQDNTRSFEKYLIGRGLKKRQHYKIENVVSGDRSVKPKVLKRFVWLKIPVK